jgi:hypothetical protein
MRKTSHDFEVKNGEAINISITPIEVGPLVIVADNSTVISNSGNCNSPKYNITFNDDPNTYHIVTIQGVFPQGTSSSAKYEIEIIGEDGVAQQIPDLNQNAQLAKVIFCVI